jgi:subtilisin family serine protease
LAVLVAIVGVPGVPAGASGERPRSTAALVESRRAGPPDVLPAGGRWTVTLLTGEVVDVAADEEGRAAVRVREHDGPFRTLRYPDGEVHVVPLAVTPLLDDVLDPALFDVTGLVRQGYDDGARAGVPLIVERSAGVDVQALVASDGEVALASIGAVAVEVPKSDTGPVEELIDGLAAESGTGARGRSGVARVWLDRRVTVTRVSDPGSASAIAQPVQDGPPLDGNLTQIGADDAWRAGFTGRGATVAVLDTGVDATHPDLAGQVAAQENFSDIADAVDHNGHGTHVASLVAGTGAAASDARSGVAPDARLIVGKVLDDDGHGTESQIIAGMEWAAPQADVVTMSLGTLGGDGNDPLSTALDNLSEEHGTLFVVAAGNDGPGSGSVGVPGVADRALTVGAVDGEDALADFSSRGPVGGSYELKPEVVAPGVDVVAARAAGTAMGDPVDATYTSASGTSMATPQVAGAAAVLVQEHPGWDADELKSTIIGSAAPLDDDGYDVGSGRIDIGVGVATTVRSSRDAVEASLPHPRTEPHFETLTWANDGDRPVTVALDAEIEDRRGEPVDEVSVEPAELTITPGATGSATLGIDGPDLGDGLYTGAVTASGGGTIARTPVAVHAAAETAELTIASTPPGGGPGAVPATFVSIVNVDDFGEFNLFTGFEGDSLTVEVPAGRYSVTGDVSTGDPDEEAVAQVGDPDVAVAGDTTVAFDGAAAVPLEPTVEGMETASPMYAATVTLTTPEAGTAGYPLVSEVSSGYPMSPVRLSPMEGDPDHFGADQLFRLQAPHLTARTGGDAIAVTGAFRAEQPAAGEHSLPAVDVGDGTDLSPASNRLAVASLPADPVERAAVTRRAAEAGVALLAFVEARRGHLTLDGGGPFDPERQWADVPVVAAAGDSARRLQAAATVGDEVTVTVAPSPYVYDIATPTTNRVDPEPVIDRAEQHRLATLRESFHRDPDGRGATADRRWSELYSRELGSAGPVPEGRTSRVTPDVGWLSAALGPEVFVPWWGGEPLTGTGALSFAPTEAYDPGSDHHLRWLRRPQWPGPVGDIPRYTSCQADPVRRSADVLRVWLEPFQGGLDGFCSPDPLEGTLTLERDGLPVPEVEESIPVIEAGDFPVPAERAEYRLTYQQEGQAPYAHRSTTIWTFPSEAPPGGDDGEVLVPLLVVGYRLPLDTLNRPTGDTATLTVRQVTGAERSVVRRVRAWTSTDGGASWRPASVHHGQGSSYELRLPDARRGTAISLRVAARDAAGSTIDQTLHAAYIR